MKLYTNRIKIIPSALAIIALFPSCEKLVDVKIPNNSFTKDVLYSDNRTAIGTLNSIITGISGSAITSNGITTIPILTGLSADEMILANSNYNAAFSAYYQNSLSPTTITSNNIWKDAYKQLYKINDAIEGISKSTTLIPAVKKQLLGEAKFFRAFCYFYLTNLYGDIPLVTSTAFEENSLKRKSSQSDIYQFIISDLKEAKDSLSVQFLDATLLNQTKEKLRPTKWAASALLSRIYLYTKNWQQAEEESDIVIRNTSLFSIDSLNAVFLKNSNEAILQAQSIGGLSNTVYAQYYYLPNGSEPNYNHPLYLSKHLLNSFEVDDNRKIKWLNKSTAPNGQEYWYPFKYQHYEAIQSYDPLTEYYMILRLGELYLIRAEARAQQNKNALALEDLNVIRNRAGLKNSNSNNTSEIIDDIIHERQVELFAEWGDRWLDLKRTNTIDNIMPPISVEKGGQWSSYKKYYPIYIEEILYNPNLTQNSGY